MEKLGKASGAGHTDAGPPRAAGCKASLPLLFHSFPHPCAHLFQGVCCSFNDLREMFVVFSDDVLQHVYRQGEVGKAPGLSRGHGAAAPRSALLRGAQSGPGTVHMEPSAKAQWVGALGEVCGRREGRAQGGGTVVHLSA